MRGCVGRADVSWWRRARGHWWFVWKFGPITWARYEAARKERERELGEEGFDPKKHGERMLRAIGATEEQIELARAKGLA